MNVSYFKDLTYAFVVSPEGLKKLVELLQKSIGKVDIRADCADDLSREFKNLKDLIAYENPKSKEILSLNLSARSDDYSKSARIRFVSYLAWAIEIDIEGREDVVSRLKDKTLDIIAGMVPSYNFMHSIKLKIALFIVFIILFLISAPLSFLNIMVIIDPEWLDALEANGNIINILMSLRYVHYIPLIIFFLILHFENKILNSFFPKAVFMIGQGKARFERQQKVRWVVIIGFAVSLAASLVVPIVMSIF